MFVIKKDGRKQKFNIEKIKLTLEKVSDELNQPLTFSDIHNLGNKIQTSIENLYKEEIKSEEILKIVIKELQDSGFAYIAKAYNKGLK